MNNNGPRILIAAGGTGGHIFPAVAVADKLCALNPDAKVLFVGAGSSLEQSLIEQSGHALQKLNLVGIKRRGLRGLLEFILSLPSGYRGVRDLLGAFSPGCVLGFGGYVSFLPVIGAWRLSIPTWIHEAELSAGLANKVLARIATRISVAYPQTSISGRGRIILTGHPIRDELAQVENPEISDEGPRRLLILGGSQGAQALDRAAIELAPFFAARSLAIWHQCRAENVSIVASTYRSAGVEAQVAPFISDMAKAYRWSQLIVSRAGAGAVREIGIVNRPAILVPYPYAASGHQKDNAKILEGQGKAIVVEEGGQFSERLTAALQQLLDPLSFKAVVELPVERRGILAAETIARGCLDLIASDINM